VIGEFNPEVYQRVVEWYETGPRQRLQPGGAIIVVQTRWSLRDLTGQLLRKQQAEALSDQWEIIELPAILPSGNPIWPEYWSLEELNRTKASIPVARWNAQYQQNPTSEEGALIKRDHWVNWAKPKPPKCSVIIQSWDTAFSSTTRADYHGLHHVGSVRERGGREGTQPDLLDAIRWQVGVPEPRGQAPLRGWSGHLLIEARGAGQPLIYN
jgi:hypothetical protein